MEAIKETWSGWSQRTRVIAVVVAAIASCCALIPCIAVILPEDALRREKIELTGVILEPTQAPPGTEPPKVWIYCRDCLGVAPDGGILPLTLWQEANDMGTGAGEVKHGDPCNLLDETVVDGIEKVKLECPTGTGWLRKEDIIK